MFKWMAEQVSQIWCLYISIGEAWNILHRATHDTENMKYSLLQSRTFYMFASVKDINKTDVNNNS